MKLQAFLSNYILVKYRLIVHRFWKLLHHTYYFDNGYGVKAYNKALFCLSNSYSHKLKTIEISCIRLGFDALRDEFTHLDISILNSPHYELINAIYNGVDISKTSYVQDEIKGCLDGRYEVGPLDSLIKKHIEANSQNNNKPPIVYQIGDSFYVIDGKHRIAKAAFEGNLSITCCIIPCSVVANHIYTRNILRYMKQSQRAKYYTKNINHINSMLQ